MLFPRFHRQARPFSSRGRLPHKEVPSSSLTPFLNRIPPLHRFRNLFSYAASADSKTSITKVKKIQIAETGDTDLFLPQLQPTSFHSEISALPIIKSAIKTLTKRNQFRNVKITLPDNVAKPYFDSEDNACFKEDYLEEYCSDEDTLSTESGSSKTSTPIVSKSLQPLTKDMVIDKFSKKIQNVTTWLKAFNTFSAAI